MHTLQFRPFYQIICIGLKTNTSVLVKTLCKRAAAEAHIQKLELSPLHSFVQYTIVERPRTTPFEVCDDCPSRKTPAPKYY
jgi:hypothetical protein